MKKCICLVLISLILSTQVMAQSENGLKIALDELNYSLTVEWDQVDSNFYEKQKEVFAQRVINLQINGMSSEEMINSVISHLKDNNLSTRVEELFKIILIEKVPRPEFEDMLNSVSANMYSTGASWNGRTTVISMVTIVVIASILYANINTSRANKKGS